AFVRQDAGHVPFAFSAVLSVILVALLCAGQVRSRIVLGSLLILDVATFLGAIPPEQRSGQLGWAHELVSLRPGTANLSRLLSSGPVRAQLAVASTANLVPDLLPPEWVARIGRSTVLVLPSEISACWANALNCVPLPTLQMYATYTAELDRWSARRLEEVRPAYVIASLGAIDQRNIVWDCPETWVTLLRGWEVVTHDATGRLLLSRRQTPSPWTERMSATTTGRVGEWLDVPPHQGPVRLGLQVQPRLSGRLRNLVLRPNVVMLQTRGASGVVRSYRLVLDTARNGILLDASPATAAELAGLFDCCTVSERVEALRLTGPGARDLAAELLLRWTFVETARGLEVARAE
ncbi:MAG TPA: hypothetical protein VFE93_08050, partial [Myxococcaceae bacterium]|nr:hypothetical protein [Myxococcaceae bacterium]